MEKRWERERRRKEREGRRKQSLLPCGFAGLPHVNAKCSTGFNVCECVFLWHSGCVYCGCTTYRIRNARNTYCKYVFILFCKQEMTSERLREREREKNKTKTNKKANGATLDATTKSPPASDRKRERVTQTTSK